MDMKTLINISGGVDSIYCAWKLLTENPNETFLLHHIVSSKTVLPKNSRLKLEKNSVDKFIEYLKKHNVNNFVYIESKRYRLDSKIKAIQDIEMVGIYTGIILRTYKNIENIVISANSEDLVQMNGYQTRSKTRFEIIDALSRNHPINYLYPIKDMTKKEISNSMPADLLQLCWYCRKPNMDGSTCGTCQPCKNISKL
jgi:7-cyano-7-deazaguanine synthase in queuosine biosynthesis